MRRERVEQLDERAHRGVPLGVALTTFLQVVLHRVCKLHQKGDGGVEPQLVVMVRNSAHGLSDLTPQDGRVHLRDRTSPIVDDRLRLQHQPPHTLQKLDNPV